MEQTAAHNEPWATEEQPDALMDEPWITEEQPDALMDEPWITEEQLDALINEAWITEEQIAQGAFEGQTAAHDEEQILVPNAVAIPQSSWQADLPLSATAPATAVFANVINYTVLITNAGPANANNVRVVQNLPANGLFEGSIAGCSVEHKTLTCNIGTLNANATRTLNLPVRMKGHDVVTSTLTVEDTGLTDDTNKQNNTARVATTVSSPNRATYTFHNVVIAANSFITETNRVTAEGAVFLAMKGDSDPPDFFIKLGPNDAIFWDWVIGATTTITAEGSTVGHITADTDLFKGNFTIASDDDAPVITPVISPSVEILYETFGAFNVVNDTRELTNVELENGTATVSATVKLNQPGITNTNQLVQGTIKPGPIAEGIIKKFRIAIGPVEITANNSRIKNDSIVVESAEIRLPNSLGGLTGIISKIIITKDSINFGGAGVKIPFPDITIYSSVTPAADSAAGSAASQRRINIQSIIVKDVSISRDGLRIGGVGGKLRIRDIKFGNALTLSNLAATLKVSGRGGVSFHEFGLEGDLRINLDAVSKPITFTATIDRSGNLTGTIEKIELTIAQTKLELNDVTLSSNGLESDRAKLTLPPILGKVEVNVSKVVINSQGISFGDANVKLPVKFTLGDPDGRTNLTVDGHLGLGVTEDKKLIFRAEGKVTLKVANQTIETKGKLAWDRSDGVRGELEEFALTIAGLKLAVKQARIENSVWKAQSATLEIPKAWGGLSATIYHVEAGNGRFSIGGGEFQLPEISVGDVKLSLKGKLKQEGRGYVIAAGGSLKLPNLGGAGCSGLGVDVEIYAGPSGQIVMQIEPRDETMTTSAVQLREIAVSARCTIPVGKSGFNLTEVSGRISLQNNTTKIELRAKMESIVTVGSLNALTADGNLGIEFARNPSKFEINIGAAMKVFSMFQAAEARATMRFTSGADVPFIFRAEMNINALIMRGNAHLTAWTDKGDFNLVGRIHGQIGADRGALLSHCVRMPHVVGWSRRDPRIEMRQTCLNIPPDRWYIAANMEFGKFRSGDNTNEWGLKAEIEVAGKRFGVYVNPEGSLSVTNVNRFQLIDAPTLRRADLLHQQLNNGVLMRAALSEEELLLADTLHFASTGEVYIDIVDLQEASDLTLLLLRSPLDADVQVTLVRPDGYEITPANLPSNATWTESRLFPNDTGEVVIDPATQIDLSIKDAEHGPWRAKLSRQPNFEFLVDIIGLSRGPAVSDLFIAEHDFDAETMTLEWVQTEGLTSTVTIYATQNPITTTASFTRTDQVQGANGLMSTEVITEDLGVVTNFDGIPIAVFENVACLNDPKCSPPPASRQLQPAATTDAVHVRQEVNVRSLRSGVYRLWIEVDDGTGHPSRTYFPGTATVGRFADPDAPDTWTSNVKAEPTFGTLNLSWDAHPNPDVYWYEVELNSRSMGSEDIYRIAVGDALAETIEGLPANQKYSVKIWTYDTASSIHQVSEVITVTIPPAPYTFTAAPEAISVIAGEAVTTSLTLTSDVHPYPEKVVLFIDEEPFNIDIDLATNVVSPTLNGTPIAVTIEVDRAVPSGTYTATLAAVSSSGEEMLHLPIHVQQGQVQLSSSQPSLTLNANGSVSVQLSTSYDVGSGEQGYLELIDFPDGLAWDFSTSLVEPGEPVTLTLSDTQFLEHGSHLLSIWVDDWYSESILELPLIVDKSGIALTGERTNRTALQGQTVTYTTFLQTTAWPHEVVIAFDPDSLIGRFTAEVTSAPLSMNVQAISVAGPAMVTAVVTIQEDTPVGVYELILQGTSNGVTTTLPLYLTVFDDATYGDVNITRTPIEYAIAGMPYSYTLTVQNAGPSASTNVSLTEQVEAQYLTLVDGDGCTYDAGNGLLTCSLGTIDPLQEVARTITWELAEDTPDWYDLTHVARVGASNEVSTYDNTAFAEAFTERLSDLSIDLVSSPVIAGLPFSYTVTIVNNGPSYDENAVVELYLPWWEAWIEVAPEECDYDNDGLLICELGEMAPGDQFSFDLDAYVDESTSGMLSTLILAYGESIDWDFENNYLFLDAPVTSVSELALEIIPDRTEVDEGETVVYTILLTNNGPSLADTIEMTIEYPDLADIVDIQVNDMIYRGQNLSLWANETLTVTVAMRFMDDDGGIPFEVAVSAKADNAPKVKEENTSVRVANTPPVITIPDVIEIEEGSYGILTANVVDAGGRFDPLTITWDLNNNGQFTDGYGATALFDAFDLSGPTTRTVRVRAEDDDGGVTERQVTIQITNVAPMVFAGLFQRLPYDATFTLNPAFFDQGPSDTHTARVEWGDGTISNINLPAGADEFTVQHTYNQVGNFEANVCVKDNSGAEGCERVKLYAACQEHGLRVDARRQGNNVVLHLHNASGTVTIPAGLPLTLYNHDTKLHTLTLEESLAIGQRQTLTYAWPNGFPAGFWLGVAVDEDAAGNKTTPLCSGLVRTSSVPAFTVYLPLVAQSARATGPAHSNTVYLPLIAR
ncbi:PKD domain-containing protein [Candidatus Viridilinea mediisalina]|uniref:PKD domain-containing protein n=1 Tax=Candidatus Viridilinea mediisalina TaxID=2024553 RepID=UPI0013FDEC50|nr:PKD domain-containing protein [Candidatus Viridilinea mediisalina]